MLKSRLYELELRKRNEMKRRSQQYKEENRVAPDPFLCFSSLQMIKDHRTDFETGNVQPVMDGELDGFIKAYLMSEKEATS